VVSSAQQKEFEKKFSKFMYNTLMPFHRLGDPDLAAALAVLGAVPPSRHVASGPLLKTAYAETVDGVISMINEFSSICITMDGWKKRSCEQGAPLITVIILLPDGTAVFWKVCTFKLFPIQLM
jgi:hypothetical protein